MALRGKRRYGGQYGPSNVEEVKESLCRISVREQKRVAKKNPLGFAKRVLYQPNLGIIGRNRLFQVLGKHC